jgi:hypothetical protein
MWSKKTFKLNKNLPILSKCVICTRKKYEKRRKFYYKNRKRGV